MTENSKFDQVNNIATPILRFWEENTFVLEDSLGPRGTIKDLCREFLQSDFRIVWTHANSSTTRNGHIGQTYVEAFAKLIDFTQQFISRMALAEKEVHNKSYPSLPVRFVRSRVVIHGLHIGHLATDVC